MAEVRQPSLMDVAAANVQRVASGISREELQQELMRRVFGTVSPAAVPTAGRNIVPDLGRHVASGAARALRPALSPLLDPSVQEALEFSSGGGLAAAGMKLPGLLGMVRAHHGSPHKFTRFSTEQIGKGQGAQTFGHGLYFAENPKVAGSYAAELGPGRGDEAQDVAARVLDAVGGDSKAAVKEIDARLARVAARRESGVGELGGVDEAQFTRRMEKAKGLIESGDVGPFKYEVDIDVDHDDLLDWDDGITAQPKTLRALERAGYLKKVDGEFLFRPDPDEIPFDLKHPEVLNDPTGEEIVRAMNFNWGSEQASRQLRDAGIPGIRYLDQGSRSVGEGTRNLVIFDDSLVTIKARNGKPIPEAERAAALRELEAAQGVTP